MAGRPRLVTVEPLGADGDAARVALRWDDATREVDVSALGSGRLSMILPGSGRSSRGVRGDEPAPGDWVVGIGGRQVRARVSDGRRRRSAAASQAGGDHVVAAPMPGRVVIAPPQRPFRHHARRLCRAQMARSREERGGATVREGRPSTALPNGGESLSCCRYHLRRFA